MGVKITFPGNRIEGHFLVPRLKNIFDLRVCYFASHPIRLDNNEEYHNDL
jgi:hypothetical protein